jgi:hypothetical protein
LNHYHIWANLRDSSRDLEFCNSVKANLGHLKQLDLINGFSIARRKFGFGPSELGEFHIVIEVRDLSQMDNAFRVVAARSGEIEKLHHAVYSAVSEFKSALYRDFPDPERKI